MQIIEVITQVSITDEIQHSFRSDIEAQIIKTKLCGNIFVSKFSPHICDIYDKYLDAYDRECAIKRINADQLYLVCKRQIDDLERKYAFELINRNHEGTCNVELLNDLASGLAEQASINLESATTRDIILTHAGLTEILKQAYFKSDSPQIFYDIIKHIYYDNKMHYDVQNFIFVLLCVITAIIPVILFALLIILLMLQRGSNTSLAVISFVITGFIIVCSCLYYKLRVSEINILSEAANAANGENSDYVAENAILL